MRRDELGRKQDHEEMLGLDGDDWSEDVLHIGIGEMTWWSADHFEGMDIWQSLGDC